MLEIFKNIEGYEGKYQYSNLGRVRSLDYYVNCRNNHKRLVKGQIMKLRVNPNGYVQITLNSHCKKKCFNIHSLVAKGFLPNPLNLPEVNHKDEDKTNNVVWLNDDGSVNVEKSNLEWCSRTYNANYGHRADNYSKTRSKKVCQYTLNNIFIKEWDNAKLASKELKIDRDNIYKAISGKRITQAGGFKWKYA